MSKEGHEEQFPRPRQSADYGIKKETIAGMCRNGSGKFVVKRKTQVKRMVRKLKEIGEEMRQRVHARPSGSDEGPKYTHCGHSTSTRLFSN